MKVLAKEVPREERLVRKRCQRLYVRLVALCMLLVGMVGWAQDRNPQVGREVAIPVHLQDGEEFTTPLRYLIEFGSRRFNAKFTIQEGAGRPQSKGTGAPISDPSSPLVFPRNFDRISSPEANACSGCHNAPVSGAGGDRGRVGDVPSLRDPASAPARRGAGGERPGRVPDRAGSRMHRCDRGFNVILADLRTLGGNFQKRHAFAYQLPVPGGTVLVHERA